eukprot:comp17550_c0_seq1/m.17135 comp17550_c0_seq1/g.17135  ORF comp17550_c0_seq1/g.17135 comp17550_c0_seq1/m.17135 type:complete len:223 (+) comp17550_c0_seq1:326-994(+)
MCLSFPLQPRAHTAQTILVAYTSLQNPAAAMQQPGGRSAPCLHLDPQQARRPCVVLSYPPTSAGPAAGLVHRPTSQPCSRPGPSQCPQLPVVSVPTQDPLSLAAATCHSELPPCVPACHRSPDTASAWPTPSNTSAQAQALCLLPYSSAAGTWTGTCGTAASSRRLSSGPVGSLGSSAGGGWKQQGNQQAHSPHSPAQRPPSQAMTPHARNLGKVRRLAATL